MEKRVEKGHGSEQLHVSTALRTREAWEVEGMPEYIRKILLAEFFAFPEYNQNRKHIAETYENRVKGFTDYICNFWEIKEEEKGDAEAWRKRVAEIPEEALFMQLCTFVYTELEHANTSNVTLSRSVMENKQNCFTLSTFAWDVLHRMGKETTCAITRNHAFLVGDEYVLDIAIGVYPHPLIDKYYGEYEIVRNMERNIPSIASRNIALIYGSLTPNVDHSKMEALARAALETSQGISDYVPTSIMAHALHEEGNTHEAKEVLKTLLRKEPGRLEAWYDLYKISEEKHELKEILRNIDSVGTGNRRDRENAEALRAITLLKMGHKLRAKRAFKRLCEQNGKNADALFWMAVMENGAGRQNRAQKLLKEANRAAEEWDSIYIKIEEYSATLMEEISRKMQ